MEERANNDQDLTAFVREVLLPGLDDAEPVIDSDVCFFGLEIRRSPIHRWGIFAKEPIPARRRIIEYTGQLINAREVRRRRFRKHLYVHWLPSGKALDGGIGGSGAEFANHSCVPNAVTRTSGNHLFLVSLRWIEPGEEILLNYRLANNGYDLPCNCGSQDCIGILNPGPQTK